MNRGTEGDGRTLCFTDVTPFSEKYGVAVAWGVVDGSKGGVPVRMLNPNDRTIKLVKGTLITQLEECDVLNTDLLSASNAIDAPSQTTLLIAISVSTSCPTLEDVHTGLILECRSKRTTQKIVERLPGCVREGWRQTGAHVGSGTSHRFGRWVATFQIATTTRSSSFKLGGRSTSRGNARRRHY